MKLIDRFVNKIKDGSLKEMYNEFSWMFSYAKNYKKEIILYTLLGIVSTVMTLLGSVASKELINIVTGVQKNRALEMAIVMISMALFSLLFTQWMSRITLKMNLKIQNEIQADIFDKVINVNWLELSSYEEGDLIHRLSSDVVTVANSAIGWLPNLIINLFNFLATLALILYYDPTMMILTLINTPIMLLSSRFLMSKMRKYNEKVKSTNSKVMSFHTETFSNIDSIKSFGLSKLFGQKLRDYQQQYKDVNLEYNLYSIKTHTLLSLIGMVINFSYFCWAVYRLWSGIINYGEMTLFMQQSSRLSAAFNSIVNIIPSTISSTISAKRLMEIVNLEKEKENSEIVNYLSSISHMGFTIKLKNVYFAYEDHKDVLVDSSLKAKPGEIIALVGNSGQGKTTIIRMLLGLVSPLDGKAELYDYNENRYDLDISTRYLFSYVPQGNTMFSGTIAENLRMVKQDASDEEIIMALKSACAYNFVNRLKKGIHTRIGSRGRGLSEGQIQRLAIARAILRDAPILLLDEATSALDPKTEKEVLKNIIVNHPNKICIVTTHRPNVLNMCKRVYKVVDTKINRLNDDEVSELKESFYR